ncbi:MAG: MFS transporter [Planctomycetales bacterium]|nr:MFS transporter [Planctomycetales bacterium]
MAHPIPPPTTAKQATEFDSIERAEPRNFVTLVAYQVVMRVGWIFKTETLVIPAFLDFVVPNPAIRGLLRGTLPVLNRFGHSVPPVLLSARLRSMGRKKWAFVATTTGMAITFFGLGVLWLVMDGPKSHWFALLFLALYAIFFVATGINHLAFNTIQGKLIRATRRGRLMTLATTIGCPGAIAAAYFLMEPWLAEPKTGFGYLFGICGVLFGLAACCAFALREPKDSVDRTSSNGIAVWRESAGALRRDGNLRRLAVVAAMFSVVLMLFPHYQAMARERLGLPLGNLLFWVAIQNAGTALFTLLTGPAADRRGNRVVLRCAVLASAVAPLSAVVMSWAPLEIGSRFFWLSFAQLGLTPVTLKLLANYTLEICERQEHPLYVSTVSLCVALPVMLLSPGIGWLISQIGFEIVFLVGSGVIFSGGIMASRLIEPRHHIGFPSSGVAVTVEE